MNSTRFQRKDRAAGLRRSTLQAIAHTNSMWELTCECFADRSYCESVLQLGLQFGEICRGTALYEIMRKLQHYRPIGSSGEPFAYNVALTLLPRLEGW